MQPSDTGLYNCEVLNPQDPNGQNQKSVVVRVLGNLSFHSVCYIAALLLYCMVSNSGFKNALREIRDWGEEI